MARNPYAVLGLAPTASDSEIRAAFRKLAKKYHPDRNPDDKKAEDKFKEVSAAFDVIGDSDRRKKFDRGEIDEEGRERSHPFGQWSGQQGAGPRAGGYSTSGPGGPDAGASFEDLSDIFSDFFGAKRGPGAGGQARPQARPQRGRDVRYRLEVDFLDAAAGAKKRVTMPDGRTLDLAIPPGLDDGQTLRLRGQGERGPAGPGDVYVEVHVKPSAVFERKGNDVYVDAPITLKEAVLGGKITAPTIAGDVSLTVPKNSSSGTVLRLRGRGIAKGKNAAAGDQYVKLKIVLPEGGDKELEEFVKSWKGADKPAAKHFAGV
ncbi:MAG: molecular chaperone DnaJ [Hyphococcus sp.]|nr:MAG: molecular chaperone DnaJ [Marinicaulis sp.]